MKIVQLTLGELGTNCYLVADEHGDAVAIDPADNAPRILGTLREHGMTLRAILLSHVHFDHIGALSDLKEATGATVYCHRLETAALTDGMRNLSALFGVPLRTVSQAEPLDEGDCVTVGTLTFSVLHTPGHTVGSVCYRLGDVLFSGDTLFCESVGRTDFPTGDAAAMKQSLARLLSLEGVARVLPGHDCETTVEHERQYNPFIGHF